MPTLIGRPPRPGCPWCWTPTGRRCVHGAAAGPAIVKPNLAELAAMAGQPLRRHGADRPAVAAAAGELRAAGAQAVVVSLGADGLLAVTADGTWRAVPPGPVAGNPTGAGDAVAAGTGPRAGPRPALGRAAAARGRAGHGVGRRAGGRRVRRGGLPGCCPRSRCTGTPCSGGRADAAHRDGGHRRAGPRGGPRRRRVQRDRHRARRGDRGRRRGGRAPVVLQISENCAAYHGALGADRRAPAWPSPAAAAVPVAVHLDHATSADLVREAAAAGLRLGHVRRVAAGLRGQRAGHRRAGPVVPRAGHMGRGGTGEIGGKDGVHAPPPAPGRTRRRGMSRRPEWTRWPSRWAARTPC